MASATAINTGVITPIDAMGLMGAATDRLQTLPASNPSSTATLPIVSTHSPLPEIPLPSANPVTSPPTPTSSTANSTTITPPPTSDAPQPTVVLPDISQMEQQLKTQGALLGEIEVEAPTDTSPLHHLQPNAIQLPSTPEPSSSSAIPLAPITLASTAPAATATQPAPKSLPVIGNDEPSIFKPILKISVVVIFLVVGFMAMAFMQSGNPFSEATSTENVMPSIQQLTGSDSDFVELDEETNVLEATWYQ